jgi:hypothetical protein
VPTGVVLRDAGRRLSETAERAQRVLLVARLGDLAASL